MNYHLSEIEHRYGNNVHILADPCLNSWLARLCSPQTFQPNINWLTEYLYKGLMSAVMNREFPHERVRIPTRMTAMHPDVPYDGEILQTEQRTVTVNLARAGTYPSHICYQLLNHVLNPMVVRQDHVLASRTTDAKDQVTGTSLGGHKIGGDIKDAIVLFPDPMGATGNTIISALRYYKMAVAGPARKFVAIHLIVTPEYLRNVTMAHPDLVIYAVRVDRGMSPASVREEIPGTSWDRERGLNDKQYIVPGGGGFGEILNNSFV